MPAVSIADFIVDIEGSDYRSAVLVEDSRSLHSDMLDSRGDEHKIRPLQQEDTHGTLKEFCLPLIFGHVVHAVSTREIST